MCLRCDGVILTKNLALLFAWTHSHTRTYTLNTHPHMCSTRPLSHSNLHKAHIPTHTHAHASTQLQAELRKRPYGDAVFEALQRTVDQEEAVVVSTGGADGAAVAAAAVGKGEGGSSEKPGGLQGTGRSGESGSGAAGFLSTGDKVWKRGAAGSGDGSSGSDEKENGRLEGERVEAAARRTALWAVARGHREKLPDSVRVRV